MFPDSLLSGDNATYLDQQYQAWLVDPQSVDEPWRSMFADLGPPEHATAPPVFAPRSIFNPAGGRAGGDSATGADRNARVVQLINAYRVRGHLLAKIDPLDRRELEHHPELSLAHYGLSDSDLDAEVPTAPLFGVAPRAKLRDVIAHVQRAYCGSIGAEFMNIDDLEQKQWVLRQLEELPNRTALDADGEQRVFRKLADAENFERLLHTRFPGTKRFSLEGAETLVPLLDLLSERVARLGVREIVIGMAHRGRLNTLVNVLGKPVRQVVREFAGDMGHVAMGSGDVKYHLGYSSDTVTRHGDRLHMSLTPNPSHLEAVDPIVEGRVRAKQDRTGDTKHQRCLALLIHGDAAFPGQGLVTEVLNLSELRGYRTGGTVHVIVNNQIGFTTAPAEGRSTRYCTDVARMLGVPIFHVNGEDPWAVAAVVEIAAAWRQTFHRDVIIDMYCYRLHGHNEGDEPSYTQPLMYESIRKRPTPCAVYGQQLVARGSMTAEAVEALLQASRDALNAAADHSVPAAVVSRDSDVALKSSDPDVDRYFVADQAKTVRGGVRPRQSNSEFKGLWQQYVDGDIRQEVDTGYDIERLRQLLRAVNTMPDSLNAHVKVKRLLKARVDAVSSGQGFDWALGEQAAFATLLLDGHPVRLSGQDSGRGTFSHRHAVITDVKTGEEYFPLRNVGSVGDASQPQGRFSVHDSSLSEAAVLGFEQGYAYDTPEGLTLWEAQFGDFANGAQVIIDQFIVASEQKWNRLSGVVLLLPHGYEGQGPEHSSARLERFLLMCAEDNIQVANVTTPAQIYHLLRRQVVRNVRKPLVVMTPKSLLRHPMATSSLEDLANGRFQPLMGEGDEHDPQAITRVVFCSGKLYYELLDKRREAGLKHVAIARVELLYPFPDTAIAAVLAGYPNCEQVVWCQEEPRNMGAWPLVAHWWMESLPDHPLPLYAGRKAAASPATGVHAKHQTEQAALLATALGLPVAVL